MLGKYYEGDMILPDGESKATTLEAKRWPNGVVPYVIDGSCGKQLSYLLMVAYCFYLRRSRQVNDL